MEEKRKYIEEKIEKNDKNEEFEMIWKFIQIEEKIFES